MLKVKVPASFSGTEGFPTRKDGRYRLGDTQLSHVYKASNQYDGNARLNI